MEEKTGTAYAAGKFYQKQLLWIGGEIVNDRVPNRARLEQYTIGKLCYGGGKENMEFSLQKYFFESDWNEENYGEEIIQQNLKFDNVAIDGGTESHITSKNAMKNVAKLVSQVLMPGGFVFFSAKKKNYGRGMEKWMTYVPKAITALSSHRIFPIKIIAVSAQDFNVTLQHEAENPVHNILTKGDEMLGGEGGEFIKSEYPRYDWNKSFDDFVNFKIGVKSLSKKKSSNLLC